MSSAFGVIDPRVLIALDRLHDACQYVRNNFDDPHVLKIVDYGADERGAPYLVTPCC